MEEEDWDLFEFPDLNRERRAKFKPFLFNVLVPKVRDDPPTPLPSLLRSSS